MLEYADEPERPVGMALEHLWCIIACIQMEPDLVPLLESRAPQDCSC